MYISLSTTAQTAYAQFQDAALTEHVNRSVAHLRGVFSRKTVKGHAYWYYVFREGTRHRQIYVGPDDERVRALVEKKQQPTDSDRTQTLARAYVAHGGTTLLPKHLRVIARLTDFGFFRIGGVLVGTHAFAAYANLLGVRWTGADRTQDVDLAMPGKNVSIALPHAPQVDLHDALSAFEAGFVPTHTFAGDTGPTYVLKGDPDFQIDFLTTSGRGGDRPRRIEALSVVAQPLKFMDYLLQNPTQAAMLDPAGRYTVATLPAPARYAVHKLIVSGERAIRYRTKAHKDLEQAAALAQWFAANDPRAWRDAWADAESRGPGWRKRLREGWGNARRRWPAISPLPQI
ncbi:MAG: nucleotidyltransferase domain-containing protein [Proteobacteria bacterium]|nr:nucleotidyltransferase domain-containing protein [Pseudomonadota bacterium]